MNCYLGFGIPGECLQLGHPFAYLYSVHAGHKAGHVGRGVPS